MLVSETRAALQPALALCSAASITMAGLSPMAQAADLVNQSTRSTTGDAQEQIAQQSGSGQYSRGSRERRRPENRPSGVTRPTNGSSARPPRGAGAGALTRPAPGFDRGNRKPPGGWIDRVPAGSIRPYPMPGRPSAGGSISRPGVDRPSSNRPGTNRPDWNRPGSSRPDWNRPSSRPDWNRPGSVRPSWSRPGWNRPDWVFSRPVQINTIVARPGWWGPNWSTSRPWRYGWYNRGYSRWNWWNQSSIAWGITSLASAAIIGVAINNALKANSPTIDVQDSPYRLIYGSVVGNASDDVTFKFLFGDASYEASANCKSGLMNGRIPQNREEAQLMNAACEVAYGKF